MKECDLLGVQNILWPLLHIFRGGGLGPPTPTSTPLAYCIIFCTLTTPLNYAVAVCRPTYTTALVITSRFQNNLRKSIPECQTSLGFATARDDGGGGGAKMCQSY